MPPTLLELPTEIRIMIYKELLVMPKPVTFVADNESPSPFLHLFKATRLYPAILRVNSQIYTEAIQVLYSMNIFQFPNLWQNSFRVPYFSPFLCEIGESNAQQIHQIRIEFPSFYEYQVLINEGANKDLQANFELIRDSFLGLKTLELILYEFSPPASDTSAELLGLINYYLGATVSLENIVIRISNVENPDSQLIEAMRDYGWKIAFGAKVERPEWKEPFYDDWGRPWDEDEYYRYQYELDQQREMEEWAEEYRRRRADPYWKNDSDYD
ncbi:hypothetical protein BJY00DRAFT_297528 [Aspergillus carlsbadensis]|nr:hypothetical protein BJY00DRAFT_297528 [Aspergillus carlsbadensis]